MAASKTLKASRTVKPASPDVSTPPASKLTPPPAKPAATDPTPAPTSTDPTQWKAAAAAVYHADAATLRLIQAEVRNPGSLAAALKVANTLRDSARDKSLEGVSMPMRVGQKAANARVETGNAARFVATLKGDKMIAAPKDR